MVLPMLGSVGLKYGDELEFLNVDPDAYESIDETLLEIHASIAEVLHMTGVGEMIEKLWGDWEELPVLAEDGTSANALSFAIARAFGGIRECRSHRSDR